MIEEQAFHFALFLKELKRPERVHFMFAIVFFFFCMFVPYFTPYAMLLSLQCVHFAEQSGRFIAERYFLVVVVVLAVAVVDCALTAPQ